MSETFRLALLTEEELFAKGTRHKTQPKSKTATFLSSLEDLNVGDYVVHVQHGIGRYRGLVNMDVGNQNPDGTPALQEFLHLEYAADAVLYVPVLNRVFSTVPLSAAELGICFAFFIVTVALPVGQLLLSSFFQFFGFYQLDMLTLDHYCAVWASREFWSARSNTMLLGLAGCPKPGAGPAGWGAGHLRGPSSGPRRSARRRGCARLHDQRPSRPRRPARRGAFQRIFQRLLGCAQIVVGGEAAQQNLVAAQIFTAQIFELAVLLVEQPEAVQRQLQLGEVVDHGQQVGEEEIRDLHRLHFRVGKADKAGRLHGHG